MKGVFMKFYERFLNGKIEEFMVQAELTQSISDWHSFGLGIRLHEYLGMTRKEFLDMMSDEQYFNKVLTIKEIAS
jgi:hypothetical protein